MPPAQIVGRSHKLAQRALRVVDDHAVRLKEGGQINHLQPRELVHLPVGVPAVAADGAHAQHRGARAKDRALAQRLEKAEVREHLKRWAVSERNAVHAQTLSFTHLLRGESAQHGRNRSSCVAVDNRQDRWCLRLWLWLLLWLPRSKKPCHLIVVVQQLDVRICVFSVCIQLHTSLCVRVPVRVCSFQMARGL